jgi:hypothetical protein
MLVVPKEKPVLTNLNTYYLKLDKLIEHCQGEMGAGGIFFKSASAHGAVYFDPDEILSGYFSDKNAELHGQSAVEQLMQAEFSYNFSVDIYRIPFENVYFWSSTPAAEKIYKDLSTEFTDLEGLIKKMGAEKLTGYIDILIGSQQESGMIFFAGGEIIGGSFSWGPVENNSVRAASKLLVEKTKKVGGIFQVCRIPIGAVLFEKSSSKTQSALHFLILLPVNSTSTIARFGSAATQMTPNWQPVSSSRQRSWRRISACRRR